MSKWYSTNREEFRFSDIDEAAAEAADNIERGMLTGSAVTIYEGDELPHDPKRWIPDVAEYLAERAYDDASEYAVDWPGSSPEQEKELQEAVGNVVMEWLDRHKLQPTFCKIINIREVKIRFTNEEGAFEVIEGKAEKEPTA